MSNTVIKVELPLADWQLIIDYMDAGIEDKQVWLIDDEGVEDRPREEEEVERATSVLEALIETVYEEAEK